MGCESSINAPPQTTRQTVGQSTDVRPGLTKGEHSRLQAYEDLYAFDNGSFFS